MRPRSRLLLAMTVLLLFACALARGAKEVRYRLDKTEDLTAVGGTVESVTYKGAGQSIWYPPRARRRATGI